MRSQKFVLNIPEIPMKLTIKKYYRFVAHDDMQIRHSTRKAEAYAECLDTADVIPVWSVQRNDLILADCYTKEEAQLIKAGLKAYEF